MKMTLVMKQWDLSVRLKKVGERVKATLMLKKQAEILFQLICVREKQCSG
jgi:hypothetical protein